MIVTCVPMQGNWGFYLVSCWCVYTSFEMPRRYAEQPDPELEEDHLKITVEDQWTEVSEQHYAGTPGKQPRRVYIASTPRAQIIGVHEAVTRAPIAPITLQ